jgi:hypothetical protein
LCGEDEKKIRQLPILARSGIGSILDFAAETTAIPQPIKKMVLKKIRK